MLESFIGENLYTSMYRDNKYVQPIWIGQYNLSCIFFLKSKYEFNKVKYY
jgi:hypothetical protein